jgi:AraC family transcriptional regulator
MQPLFVQLPEMKVAGLGARFISILSPNKNNSSVIPALWHQFMQQWTAIPNKTGDASFGLVEMLPEPRSDPAEMFYIAAGQVTTFDGLPSHWLRRTLAAGRYAKFTHKGKLDGLGKTAAAIYQAWLPQSGEKLRPAPHLEWYDQRFDMNSDASEFDILLPLA